MATRSTYVFQREDEFEEAKNHFYNLMRDDYYDSNKLYFYGYWGSCSRFGWEQCYKIEIGDDCTDSVKAASIIREHGGRFYE